MQLENIDMILEEKFRKEVISDMIDDQENLLRKIRELRKHDIYRDKNSKWVMDAIQKESFRQVTIEQMRNRASNISICRKIVNKLARAYIGGVLREVKTEGDQESIDKLERELDVTTHMKKADRYRQLFRNTLVGVIPNPSNRESREAKSTKWDLEMRVLAPWEYDVLEDNFDHTKPRVVILTDFPERYRFQSDFQSLIQGAAGVRTRDPSASSRERGDRSEQHIADSPEDAGTDEKHRRFIWWSDEYHFTTDNTGAIVDVPSKDAATFREQVTNPIGLLPWENIAGDQDGQYWAQGGEDVTDGSILINKILTDVNFITFIQGWGQLVISAKDVPKKIKGGPDNAFIFDIQEGDPVPQVFYATSNPPIQGWLDTIMTTLAMILSTNNLSVRNIATKLDAATAASGIALLIENSESLDDIRNLQEMYRDKEPQIWEILRRWHELFAKPDALVKNLQEINPFKDADVRLKFNEFRAPISEKEKLEEIKIRKELGINSMAELLMKDNPDLSEDEAKERIKKLTEEKKEKMEQFGGGLIKNRMETEGIKNASSKGIQGNEAEKTNEAEEPE